MNTQERSNLIAARNTLASLYRSVGPTERQQAIGSQIDAIDAKLKPKRQSTTARISKLTAQCIAQDCMNGNGVIVRLSGREVGVIRVYVNQWGETMGEVFGGGSVKLSDCTIRKTTLPRLPMIGETREQHMNAVVTYLQ